MLVKPSWAAYTYKSTSITTVIAQMMSDLFTPNLLDFVPQNQPTNSNENKQTNKLNYTETTVCLGEVSSVQSCESSSLACLNCALVRVQV